MPGGESENNGESPDRDLPIDDYDRLTVDQVAKELNSLSHQEAQLIKSYEQKHKKRKTLIDQLDRKLSAKEAENNMPGMPESWLTTNRNWVLVSVGALILLWLIF